jgi:hypothetical protein
MRYPDSGWTQMNLSVRLMSEHCLNGKTSVGFIL